MDGTSALQLNSNALQPSCALPESVHLQWGCKSYLLLSLVLVHSALADGIILTVLVNYTLNELIWLMQVMGLSQFYFSKRSTCLLPVNLIALVYTLNP